ncbi:phosphoribosylamine/glycine ligase [Clostridium cellulovorans 743B]|uniref:Phosphoribosylamine--glycine ligase n=2 Tax=Clostridium cellulovorans TaxID=1493 RepID=D9SX03_CLOC7|nr:phosphoribosylamine/glycine ligase [Clostridium cellulovorans 743B]
MHEKSLGDLVSIKKLLWNIFMGEAYKEENTMDLMIIGNGGREHALAWKLAQSDKVNKIYCAPGNGGTAIENKCVNVDLNTIEEMKDFALENKVDLTIVGPEVYLVQGVVDLFKKNNLKIFGPAQAGAELEGSKSFAKDFMKKYNVKTADYQVFNNLEDSIEHLKKCDFPIVIKADGLAAGKGVYISPTYEEAEKALRECMEEDVFKGAGKTVVIEEFLEGVEASILTITDGKTIVPFLSSKDHKKIYEGETGPNTGGMGVIAPNPYYTDEVKKEFEERIMAPTLEGIQKEGFDFKGIIFFGIMVNKKGVYLLEYNCRMGDPETQCILPLLKTDLLEIIELALEEKLEGADIQWEDKHSCCVTLASLGYPGTFEKGFEITGYDKVNGKYFGAAVTLKDGKVYTNGGRVLNVVNVGENLEAARAATYEDVNKVDFKNKYYRKDIGNVQN